MPTVRPWKERWKAMILVRPVAWWANLTAASTASAPLLEKKKVSSSGDQAQHRLVDETDVRLEVQTQPGLPPHRLDDARMAVAGVDDADTAGEIQVTAARVVPDVGSLSAHEGGIQQMSPHRRDVLPGVILFGGHRFLLG